MQFETLNNQVNPHFLFNSLNTLSGLIDMDKELSKGFIDNLSQVYRYVLQNKDEELVTTDNHCYPVNNTLDELEEMLDPKQFARANCQFIIIFDTIQKIHPYFKGRLKIDLKPKQNADLAISAEKSKGFKEWLDQ